jgi:hypothetical protein
LAKSAILLVVVIESDRTQPDKLVIHHQPHADMPDRTAARLQEPRPSSFAGVLQFAMNHLRCLSSWGRPNEKVLNGEILAVTNAEIGKIKIKDEDDALALQYLGAAVILSWACIPQETREMLLVQSGAITGLEPASDLQEQIKWLLRNNVKAASSR